MNRDLKMDKNTEEFFKKLLDSRELRYERQAKLVEKDSLPIISFMLNTPGLEKRNEKLLDFHKKGVKIIKNSLDGMILSENYFDEDTGMVYMASVRMDAKELKKKMMNIEESEVGRLYDIDVFDENLDQITRTSLDYPPRKCIVCENVARECIKERRHSYKELIEMTYNIIDNSNSLS